MTPTHSQMKIRYGAGLFALSTPNARAPIVTANSNIETVPATPRVMRDSR